MEPENRYPAPPELGQFARIAHAATREMSEASTVTLCGNPYMDVEMQDADPPAGSGPTHKRYVVSVDFGTTFSSISFVSLPIDEVNPRVHPADILSIVNYPDDPDAGNARQGARKEVPTESWYPNKALIESPALWRIRDEGYDDMDDHPDNALHEGHKDIDDDHDPPEGNNDIDGDQYEEESNDFYWGYGVQKQLNIPDIPRNQNRRIKRSKLLLDNSQWTKKVRDELEKPLKTLKNKRIIKNNEDVIADYLEHLFRHTKDQLTANHGFTDACPVEFVLCVPAIWTQKASRTMQRAMETAIRKSGFGSVENGSVENLFIVSEPEAASAYVLAADKADVKLQETFVLLDAGGGTVDAITYKVSNNQPLRLEREAFEPGGDLCGSSYLNEAFEADMLKRLEDEKYLEEDGLTIRGIVDQHMLDFENKMKRIVDVTKMIEGQTFIIPRLRENRDPEKRFLKHQYRVDPMDIRKVFNPLLERVARLMKQQLDLAKERNLAVEKVVLIGGFAASPSLRNYLSRALRNISNSKGGPITLINPDAPETAVASGAVLRALNKKAGPARTTLSSYGFLLAEPYNPESWDAHKDIRPWHDPLDGRKWVKNTIDWLIKKGEIIPPQKEYPVSVEHIFPEAESRLMCSNELYVSDTSTESHYRKGHPKNAGAELAGEIDADMTFLRTQGLIQPLRPGPGETWKSHYKIEYELVMIIDGRNLRYEARWPVGGATRSKGQISIAAAFVPGTN